MFAQATGGHHPDDMKWSLRGVFDAEKEKRNTWCRSAGLNDDRELRKLRPVWDVVTIANGHRMDVPIQTAFEAYLQSPCSSFCLDRRHDLDIWDVGDAPKVTLDVNFCNSVEVGTKIVTLFSIRGAIGEATFAMEEERIPSDTRGWAGVTPPSHSNAWKRAWDEMSTNLTDASLEPQGREMEGSTGATNIAVSGFDEHQVIIPRVRGDMKKVQDDNVPESDIGEYSHRANVLFPIPTRRPAPMSMVVHPASLNAVSDLKYRDTPSHCVMSVKIEADRSA
ncbi:hypothetical protein BKA70DRAFT_1220360 [Coprinopsis sp. MPI-PUGE-AT-0042]|nr:hypothetical protein BKA70DRAFT_1220360 [Coprinopsis sp. MPI-PUGE-AT-0042]